MQVVGGMVDVEGGHLVLQVQLQLVTRVPVGAQLLVDLLQGVKRNTGPIRSRGGNTKPRGAKQTFYIIARFFTKLKTAYFFINF